jgi:predicted TIM-barrel fold metal-dependent hydrolase
MFPEEIRNKRESYCRRDRVFASIYENPKARMASPEDVLAALSEIGAHKAVVFGFQWEDVEICRDHNDFIREACISSGGKLEGLGCISPASGKKGLSEADRCLRLGLSGIGEVGAYRKGEDQLRSAFFDELAEALRQWQRPLLLHATEPVGHVYPGKDRTNLHELYQWLTAHPDLDVILAHWGGGLFFYELMPEVKEVCRRVFYDTSASPFLYRPSVYRVALEIVGRDRLLLASDFPLIHPKRNIQEIRDLGLLEKDIEGLLGLNAARLWRWGEGVDRE